MPNAQKSARGSLLICFQLMFNNSVLKHDPLFLLGALLVAPICWSHLVAQGCVLYILQRFLNDCQHVPPAGAYRPSTCCNFGNVENTHISNGFCMCCDLNIFVLNLATFRGCSKHIHVSNEICTFWINSGEHWDLATTKPVFL